MPIEGVQTTSKKLCHHPSRAVPPPKTAFFVQECGIFMSGGSKRGVAKEPVRSGKKGMAKEPLRPGVRDGKGAFQIE